MYEWSKSHARHAKLRRSLASCSKKQSQNGRTDRLASRLQVSVVQSVANKNTDRTYTFDKVRTRQQRGTLGRQVLSAFTFSASFATVPQVFGPNVTQKKLYDDAITPIVDEVSRVASGCDAFLDSPLSAALVALNYWVNRVSG